MSAGVCQHRRSSTFASVFRMLAGIGHLGLRFGQAWLALGRTRAQAGRSPEILDDVWVELAQNSFDRQRPDSGPALASEFDRMRTDVGRTRLELTRFRPSWHPQKFRRWGAVADGRPAGVGYGRRRCPARPFGRSARPIPRQGADDSREDRRAARLAQRRVRFAAWIAQST